MSTILMLLAFVPAILFNIGFFVLKFVPTLSGWVSWVAINIAFIATVKTVLPCLKTKDASMVGSQAALAVYHQQTQFIIGLILMIINAFTPVSWGLTLVIHLAVASGFVIFTVMNHTANDKTMKSQREKTDAQRFMNMVSDELYALWKSMPENKEKATVERAYDSARTMHLSTTVTATELDDSILQEVVALKNAVGESNSVMITEISKKICALIEQRNIFISH